MTVYELTHLFFSYGDDLVHSPKKLGLYYTYENVKRAIRYYSTQPGFCDNQEAFSSREISVIGIVENDTVFEAAVYLHSLDYEFESEIALGLYGTEIDAKNTLIKYCRENSALVNSNTLVVEKIISKRVIGKREWEEGFSIFD